MSESVEREARRQLVVYLDELEHAFIRYDEISDTLYINLSNEEADETLLLENNIIVHVKNNRIIGLTILDLLRRVKEA
ncbi:MAG TPA: DUF2283 domain-containing protein [Ignisphaera sp.]|uniref:DUF2283 domain-containing protein n=1 Tax=Ignisphaera aggregans TaxID=334771 RepID=A0A832YXR8_9CREN|nr:DUF2283 domain-containing protein [Ignisphaera sp.]HIP56759.1 DUF2283 domain-containing protein [Ignisphaera aggregans]